MRKVESNLNFSYLIKKFIRPKKKTGFNCKFKNRTIYKITDKSIKTPDNIDYTKLGKLVTFKPTTQSRRIRVILNKKGLTNELESGLFQTLHGSAGRNRGRISVKARKGKGKQKILNINNNLREVDGLVGIVRNLVYYAKISSHLALVEYTNQDGKKILTYILRSQNMKIGDEIQSGNKAPLKEGNNLPLSSIPDGYKIHNLEIKENRGGILIRAAGSSGTLVSKGLGVCKILLPSKRTIIVDSCCRASIGGVSNFFSNQTKCGGAGYGRKTNNTRPRTRLTAKNPVDGANTGSVATRKGLKRGVKTRKRKISNRSMS